MPQRHSTRRLRRAIPEPAQMVPHVLRDYALVADGERGALVGPRGDLALMCFPRWDSDAIFSSLIGGRGGYTITPGQPSVWGGDHDPGSLIWHSRRVTITEELSECREAPALPTRTDRAVILQRAMARGTARFELQLSLRAGFGHEP